MASFEEIMNRPATDIKPPQAYPVGTYHCLVDGPAEAGKSSQKQTDYLRFKFKILSPGTDVDAKAAAEQQIVGKIIQNDYYITDGSSWRLTELLEQLDLPIDDETIPLKQLVGMAPGRQIMVKLRHESSQDGRRVFHRVADTAHV